MSRLDDSIDSLKEISTDLGDSTDFPSDWDVVSSSNSSGDDKENQSSKIQGIELVTDIKLNDNQTVEDDLEISCRNSEASSSSDIEVIDENLEQTASSLDVHASPTTYSSSESKLELSGLGINAQTIHAGASTDDDNNIPRSNNLSFDMTMREFFAEVDSSHISKITGVAIFSLVGLCIYIFMQNSYLCKDQREMIQQMKQLTDNVRQENAELREKLLLEVHNKGIFSSLEGQITQLKNENLKLNQMLQEVVSDMQKQSHISESEFLNKVEVKELKEQINILQFENEELQKQVAKFRYGRYASRQFHDEEDSLHLKNNQDRDANSDEKSGIKQKEGSENTTVLAEEMKKLQEELIAEIEKVKKWSEKVEESTKNLHKSIPEKEQEPKKQEWTLNDVKKSFADMAYEAQSQIVNTVSNLPNMNVSEFFAQYLEYDINKLKSFYQYLKTAKEDTMKVLRRKENKDHVVNNFWKGINSLGKMIDDVKRKIYSTTEIVDEDGKEKAEKNPENTAEKEKTSPERSVEKEEISSENEVEKENLAKFKSEFDAEEMWNSKTDDELGENQKPNWYLKNKHKSHSVNNDGHKKQEPELWMFKRADYREKRRQNDDSVNWYLKRKKYHNTVY